MDLLVRTFLSKISQIQVGLSFSLQIIDDKIINKAILNNIFFTSQMSVEEYKIYFFGQLDGAYRHLIDIEKEICISYSQIQLGEKYYNLLLEEIASKKNRINFLKETFDIEYQKYDKAYAYHQKSIDYSFYNKEFFGLETLPRLEHSEVDYLLKIKKDTYKEILVDDINKCIAYSQLLLPGLCFTFHDKLSYFFDEADGKIHIKKQKTYSLQNLIVIFFHEVTHYFRYKNGINNLGFNYTFSDYGDLEEGIALYNEYYYGNQIYDYGEYIPYYDLCLTVLQQEKSTQDKIREVQRILGYKGFDEEKSLGYFYRFYRFCILGGTDVFLKDAIYFNGLKNVKALLNEDMYYFQVIMSGRIGLKEIKQKIYSTENNEDMEIYFQKMSQYIKNNIL